MTLKKKKPKKTKCEKEPETMAVSKEEIFRVLWSENCEFGQWILLKLIVLAQQKRALQSTTIRDKIEQTIWERKKMELKS